MQKEIWKPIKGYEGIYEISTLGRVKSLGRRGSGASIKDKILRPGRSTSGYLFYNLCKSGKTKIHQAHRLVAIHFISNPKNKKEVNHIDAKKHNNFVDNLEWATPSENIRHGLKMGIMNTEKGSKKHNAILNESQVLDIKKRIIKGDIGTDIARDYGVHKSVIYGISLGKTWKHVLV